MKKEKNQMTRLTYRSPATYLNGDVEYSTKYTKQELVVRLAEYENSGLEPAEVKAMADDSFTADEIRFIKRVFETCYQQDYREVAKLNKTADSIFKKLGIGEMI